MAAIDIPSLPENPDYGSGCFRRRIRLQSDAGQVTGELEDNAHGFRCTVHHDGRAVTDVRAEGLRIPYSTCGGAAKPLRELIGIALGTDARRITETVDPLANCTHMYDLALLAIAQAHRGEGTRQYDVRVDDAGEDGISDARVWRDAELIHHWTHRDMQVVDPEAYRGRPLFKGFAAWANETFEGDRREAAFVLHKGVFVGMSRRYDISRLAGYKATDFPHMPGACYSLSPGVAESAVRLADTVRDFSDCPEELLKFR